MLILTRRIGETLFIELPTGVKLPWLCFATKAVGCVSVSRRRPSSTSCGRKCSYEKRVWSRGGGGASVALA
jgi:hypothetical protein